MYSSIARYILITDTNSYILLRSIINRVVKNKGKKFQKHCFSSLFNLQFSCTIS